MSTDIKKIADIAEAANFLAEIILKNLQNEKRVFWMITSGSPMTLAVEVSKIVSKYPHSNLSVTLNYERYVPVGDKNSNWQQLLDKGFVLPEARLFPILKGESLEATVASFSNTINREFAFADYKVGLFGIGTEGQTAGILPKSEAIFAPGVAFSYRTPTSTRITVTNKAILELDEAVIFTEGEEKRPVVESLKQELGVYNEPAQVLKKVPTLTIFFKT